ncbi:MAG: hypothetical protein OQL16_02660 [Gammaproteobacteria bacterium]|nr:hypothetical protein [Gammaproteobacteria bacterium]
MMAGCQTLGSSRPENYIAHYQDYPPEVKRFQVCHDIHCENLTPVTLDSKAWSQLARPFTQTAASASQEREQVKSAIALFEEVVGPIAKTGSDRARNISGGWGNRDRQLDCIAETINTTTYLLLIEQQGWLKWHRTATPEHRGWFTLHAPHNTAVLEEKASGRKYAVDSWFHANGEQPEVVPINQWTSGFDPEDTKP